MIETFLFFLARVFCAVSDWFLSKALSAKNKRISSIRPAAITPVDFRDFYCGNPPGTTKRLMAERSRVRGCEELSLYDLDPDGTSEVVEAFNARMKAALVQDTK